MTGGQSIKVQPAGSIQKDIKLNVSVAFDTRVRGQPERMSINIRLDNLLVEGVTVIENEVIDV